MSLTALKGLIMQIHELITMLQKFDTEAEVVGTWKGETRGLDVYQAADGRIMVDADDCFYKTMWQETKCEVCGLPARGEPYFNKSVCYKHWDTFKEQ